ncbi:MAG: hypothetical protein K6T85_14720 [Gorillibacterium sp.]|nr:hypothetical protein [Gorillibacterium sp.]
MQPLTAKEVEYIVDSMSNEELMLKQCAATASISANAAITNLCVSQSKTHEQHLQSLMNLLTQHQSLAPQQPGTTQQH